VWGGVAGGGGGGRGWVCVGGGAPERWRLCSGGGVGGGKDKGREEIAVSTLGIKTRRGPKPEKERGVSDLCVGGERVVCWPARGGGGWGGVGGEKEFKVFLCGCVLLCVCGGVSGGIA